METQATTTTAAAPGGRIASRLWVAARTEFSSRGYHGARVQGIAKRAGCNVALLYRHWASKRALYVEILKSIWVEGARKSPPSSRPRGAPRALSPPTSTPA